MILADTSVWIGYFRGEESTEEMGRFLDEGQVLLHPWILGELLLGNLGKDRHAVARDLRRLPAAPRIDDEEQLRFVEARNLPGRGIGWVDAQLLASALASESRLWTLDRKLAKVASELQVAL
jgi:predicted nucleic acid-binding protein